MSAVNITNVAVLDSPTAFLNPFQFEISYECLCLLPLEDARLRIEFERSNEAVCDPTILKTYVVE